MSGNRNSGRRPRSSSQRASHESRSSAVGVEPAYPIGVPPAPATLGKVGLEEWQRVRALLEPQGVLTQADYAILIDYASIHERLEQVRVEIAKPGFTPLVEGRENPLCSMERRLTAQRRQLLLELGLTPASRARTPAAPRSPGQNGAPASSSPGMDFDQLTATLAGRRSPNGSH